MSTFSSKSKSTSVLPEKKMFCVTFQPNTSHNPGQLCLAAKIGKTTTIQQKVKEFSGSLGCPNMVALSETGQYKV